MSELEPRHGTELERQVKSLEVVVREGDPATIHQRLRQLQSARLPQSDLRVLIERLRAANDATAGDAHFEESARLALEMVEGLGPFGLRWDSAARLPALLEAVLDADDLKSGLATAFAPTDLLPPRPSPSITEGEADRVVAAVLRSLSAEDLSWEADLFLVPKSSFTNRPMSLLPLHARVWYEALAQRLVPTLQEALPEESLWPRNREEPDQEVRFRRRPLGWKTPYIAKADISTFYASIDHEMLGEACHRLGMTLPYVEAVECFLGATTRRRTGLPQGPRGSDVFASAVLAGIDRKLVDSGQLYLRFADDYFFPAESVAEGRKILERLEELLADRGLFLSDHKTTVMRRSTYAANMTATRDAARRLRETYVQDFVARLEAAEDTEFVEEILARVGVEEETLWDLLYHHTISLRDVIEQVRDELSPSDRFVYEQLLSRAASDLEGAKIRDVSAVASLAGESILGLAAAEGTVEPPVLVRLLEWFPFLARHVSSFLLSLGEEHREYVSATADALLAFPDLGDWERAWLVQSLVESPQLLTPSLRERLEAMVSGPQFGLLCRLSASRALGLFQGGPHPALESLWRDATPAIRSEMIFLAEGRGRPALG